MLLFDEYRGLNSDKEFQPQITSLGLSLSFVSFLS